MKTVVFPIKARIKSAISDAIVDEMRDELIEDLKKRILVTLTHLPFKISNISGANDWLSKISTYEVSLDGWFLKRPTNDEEKHKFLKALELLFELYDDSTEVKEATE